MGTHEFLHEVSNAMTLIIEASTSRSQHAELGEGVSRQTTMLEYKQADLASRKYAYEVTKIEVLDGQTTKPLSVSSRKSNTPNGRSNVSDVFVSGASY